MDDPPKKFKPANVVSVASAHMLHDVYSSFFAPLLPLLTEKLGFTYAVAGMLSVVQKLPSLLNPLIGFVADRFAVRSAIIAAPVLTITAMGLIGIAPSTALLAVLMFTCGISAAVFHVTAPVLMRRVSGNRIGRGMSFFMFGGEIARTAGPLLVTAAVSWWGLEGTWRLIPLGWVASLLIFLNLRTIDKRHIHRFRKTGHSPLIKTLREVAPFFAQVAPILLFRGFPKTALTLFLPAYMVERGCSITVAAIALAFLELAGAGGVLLAGSWSDRAGRKPILLAIMLVSPVLMYLFTYASGAWLWVLLGFMGLVFFASTPVFMAMIHDLDSDRPTFANGIFMTVSFAAGSIVALCVGFLADRFGFAQTYQITAALSLCAIPPTLFIRDRSGK